MHFYSSWVELYLYNNNHPPLSLNKQLACPNIHGVWLLITSSKCHCVQIIETVSVLHVEWSWQPHVWMSKSPSCLCYLCRSKTVVATVLRHLILFLLDNSIIMGLYMHIAQYAIHRQCLHLSLSTVVLFYPSCYSFLLHLILLWYSQARIQGHLGQFEGKNKLWTPRHPSLYEYGVRGGSQEYACNDATSNYMRDTYTVAVQNTTAHEGSPHNVLHSFSYY